MVLHLVLPPFQERWWKIQNVSDKPQTGPASHQRAQIHIIDRSPTLLVLVQSFTAALISRSFASLTSKNRIITLIDILCPRNIIGHQFIIFGICKISRRWDVRHVLVGSQLLGVQFNCSCFGDSVERNQLMLHAIQSTRYQCDLVGLPSCAKVCLRINSCTLPRMVHHCICITFCN